MKTYWVELLLSNGKEYGVPVDAFDLEDAGAQAMQSPQGWGLPSALMVNTISDFETSEILFDRQTTPYEALPRSAWERFGILRPEADERPLTNGSRKDTLTGKVITHDYIHFDEWKDLEVAEQ